ncbi:MAG: hypothetical protein ACXADW_03680 [Candidatus Hodarchaeales archaeon]
MKTDLIIPIFTLLIFFTALAPVSTAPFIFEIKEVNEISSGSNICDVEMY